MVIRYLNVELAGCDSVHLQGNLHLLHLSGRHHLPVRTHMIHKQNWGSLLHRSDISFSGSVDHDFRLGRYYLLSSLSSCMYLSTTSPNVNDIPVTSNHEAQVIRTQVTRTTWKWKLGPHVTGLLEPAGPHEQGLFETTGITVAGQLKHGLLSIALLGPGTTDW